MANTVKFNHLYTVELVNEVEAPAFDKIFLYLTPFIKDKFTPKQIEHLVSFDDKVFVPSAFYSDTSYTLDLFRSTLLPHIQQAIGLEWMNASKGTFPKRLSSYFYKQYGVKMTAEHLSQVGTLASAANANKKDVYFDIFDCATDKYWKSGAFGDSGSCLWGGRGGALDSFKLNKAMALRIYYEERLKQNYKDVNKNKFPTIEEWFSSLSTDEKYRYGRGRAWMYYVEDTDAYIFWNGYDSTGTMQAVHYARIWATVCGHTYHKITQLHNQGNTSSTIYINAGSGWITHAIGNTKAEILKSYDLNFKYGKSIIEPDATLYECEDCGWSSHDEEDFFIDHQGRYICQECRDDHYSECNYDGQLYYYEDMQYVDDGNVVIDGRKYYGGREYGLAFQALGYIVWANDVDAYIWRKHAYYDEENSEYLRGKPKKEPTI